MLIFLRLLFSLIFKFNLLQMHPWKKIIRGNTQEEETTTCFMCLKRVTNLKLEKHMTKFHAATCPMARLDEMCREAEEEQATEGLNFDEIIEEEKERQETLRKKRMETGGLMGMFRRRQERVTEPEQGTQDTISLKCFLCQGKWTGNSKEELTEHLEKAHKVVFKIKELIELSESQPEELETAANEESRGEEERLLTVASETETGVDTTSGDTISQCYSYIMCMDCQHNFSGQRDN